MTLRSLLVGPGFEQFWFWRLKLLATRSRLLRKIYQLRCDRILYQHNASIPESAQFLDRPFFPHGLNGIFISEGARIGRQCTIFHQVTIGSNTLANTRSPGAPVIGDRVLIGAGAKIIGGVQVGNDVRIGANCVVVRDVPANATVVLSQPRTIEHSEVRDNSFQPYGTLVAMSQELTADKK